MGNRILGTPQPVRGPPGCRDAGGGGKLHFALTFTDAESGEDDYVEIEAGTRGIRVSARLHPARDLSAQLRRDVTQELVDVLRRAMSITSPDLLPPEPALAGSLEEALQVFKGAELSSVVFVRDYLQFVFEAVGKYGPRDNRLTAYIWPIVVAGSSRLQSGDVGYRDPLVGRINRRVSEVTADRSIVAIDFEDEISITISLRPEDSIGRGILDFYYGTYLYWEE
jgi:hypothetical protein